MKKSYSTGISIITMSYIFSSKRIFNLLYPEKIKLFLLSFSIFFAQVSFSQEVSHIVNPLEVKVKEVNRDRATTDNLYSGISKHVATITRNTLFDSSPAGFSYDDVSADVITTLDGGTLIGGKRYDYSLSMTKYIYVVKLDASDNIQWTYRIDCNTAAGFQELDIYSLYQTADGSIYILGNFRAGSTGTDLMIKKLTSTGTLIYSKFYNFTGTAGTYVPFMKNGTMVQGPGGNIYVGWTIEDMVSLSSVGGFMEITSAGVPLFSGYGSGSTIKMLSSGRIGLLGQSNMCILNPDGSYFTSFNLPMDAYDFTESGNVFYFVGTSGSNACVSKITLSIFGSSSFAATVNWFKTYKFYSSPTDDQASYVSIGDDGNLIVGGSFYTSTPSGHNFPAYLKINSTTGSTIASSISETYSTIGASLAGRLRGIRKSNGDYTSLYQTYPDATCSAGFNLGLTDFTPLCSVNGCNETVVLPTETASTVTSTILSGSTTTDGGLPMKTYSSPTIDYSYTINKFSGCSATSPTIAPVADFVGTPTTVAAGGSVNFTDLSINSPTSWSWTFTGGSPTTSTLQNPTGIVYSTAGCYQVVLTATNSSGSDTKTKVCYITVTTGGGGGSSGCDTIQNVHNADNFLIYAAPAGGYVSGHNAYGDLAKADLFTTYAAGDKINGVFMGFARAKYSTTAKTINVRVWDNDGAGGIPSTVLVTKTITIASLAPSVAAGTEVYIPFATPVTVSGPFYLGIEFSYAAGDTVALYTNTDGETAPGTAWEKWSSGAWVEYSDPSSWSINVSNYIRPVMCSAITEVDDMNNVDISVFPNPVTDELNINTGKESYIKKIILYGIDGRKMYEENYSGNQEKIIFDLTNFSKGIYFLDCISERGSRKVKVVKE